MTSNNPLKISCLMIGLAGLLCSTGSYAVDAPSNTIGTETSQSEDGSDVTWSWSAVPGAVRYRVTIDGENIGDISETSVTSTNLRTGIHAMSVEAVDANDTLSDKSPLTFVYVENDISPDTLESVVLPGDENAAAVESLIDPSSYNYPEVTQKPGYELAFSDEFNGTALNPFRWNSQLRWDGEFNGERYEYRLINGEDQFYVNVLSEDDAHRDQIAAVYDPFQFNGSTLSIRSTINPLKSSEAELTFGSLDDISTQQTFLSGALTTHDKFTQKYGYFEARIKIPSAIGTFPAFWLLHDKEAFEGTQRTEIDIMENLGHAPWYVYNSFHYFKNVSSSYFGDANFVKPQPSGQIYSGTNYSEDFHVYAVEWTEGSIIWYLDGEQVSEVSNSEADYEELYVILNLAIGGNWTNFPASAGGLGRDADNRFPNLNDLIEFNDPALEIDYVRVYKRQ